MKLHTLAINAAGVAFMVSCAFTVSANAQDADSNLPTTASVVTTDLCVGLPRNTVLSNCPAPCVQDAPCVVYDQSANFSTLTGCDYDTATVQSFCTRAERQAQTCEIHCFPPSPQKGSLAFQVRFRPTQLPPPEPRNMVENFDGGLDFYRASYQVNNFVNAIGKLNASANINDIYLAGAVESSSGINLGGSPPPSNRFVEIDVHPEVLASVPAVKKITLQDLPLGSDRTAEILSHASTTVIELFASRLNITSLPDDIFAAMMNIEKIQLSKNPIMVVSPGMFRLPKLRNLDLSGNAITTFNIEAPRLESLILSNNRLVRIPPMVFTLTRLRTFYITGNLIATPLVLSQSQVDFLNAIFSINIDLVSPPSTSPRAAVTSGGSASNADDLSQLLVNATTVYLRGMRTLPVRIVSSENAEMYNDLLEQRAYPVDSNGLVGQMPPTTPPPAPTPTTTPSNVVPNDLCEIYQRKTLYSNCAGRCANDGPCVVYDVQDKPSGCDYDVASPTSYCTNFVKLARTCEFHCFAAYDEPSTFKFAVPFATDGYTKIPRRSFDDGSFRTAKTAEVPFLANPFLEGIGFLTLSSEVTDISISGGRTESGTRGRVADVAVSSTLLSKAPSVTSLSLMNIDLSSSDLPAILASSPPRLKSLNLRNTLITAVPVGGFARMQQLESLILSQNELTSIVADDMAVLTLKNLDLSDNALTALNLRAPNLAALDLSGNNFVRVPPAVFSLTNLKYLNLLDNPISLPLVVSENELAFLISIVDRKLPESPSIPSSRSPPAINSTDDIVVGDGSELLVSGNVTMVGGTPVIVVSQSNADRFNDLLEENQKSALVNSRSANATGAAGSNSTSSGAEILTSKQPTTDTTSDSTTTNASIPSTQPRSSTSKSDVENADPVSKQSGSSLALLLIASSIAAVLLVVIILLCIFIRRRRRGKGADGANDEVYSAMVDKAGGSSGVVTAPSKHESIAWWRDDDMLSHRLRSADITDQRVVRGGGFGIVWLVEYRSRSQQLVSKRLIQSEGPAHEARVLDLFAEAKVASTLNHPSIVPFVGVAWTDKTDFQVLYEYMPNGDLGSYLAQTDTSTLPWIPDKLQLAIDIIEALVYTHSFNPPLLHRDLKSSNVLLDNDLKAKLGDFACARPESDSNTMTTNEIGTGRWLAPEILAGSTSYGSSSDIYSFGVVLCELDTHQMPFATDAIELDEATLLQRVARGELRPALSESCPPEIRVIVESCLAFEPSGRPTAMQVAYMLRSLLPRREVQASTVQMY